MTFFSMTRRGAITGGLFAFLAGCANRSQVYDGPEVTRVRLYKSQRLLMLDGPTKPLRTYEAGLGFAPTGHKQFEGDGKTPEGSYTIDRRNPNSMFHLSIGISYPNTADKAFAAARGQSPGSDIFIHGGPRPGIDPMDKQDWTAGCIAVTDREIEEIYMLVRDGTPIDIYA